jgi:hypothetical protein
MLLADQGTWHVPLAGRVVGAVPFSDRFVRPSAQANDNSFANLGAAVNRAAPLAPPNRTNPARPGSSD